MSRSVNESPEFNGFLYNPRLLFAPCYYGPLALQQLAPYMTHEFAPRIYSAPTDPTVAIGAGLTLRTQLRILPGSVIVGWRVAMLSGSVNDLRYQVTDGDTQKSFTQGNNRFISARNLIPSGKTGIAFCLFPKVYQLQGGMLTLALSNVNTTTPMKCQMVVFVLEPVQSPTTSETGSVMVPLLKGAK